MKFIVLRMTFIATQVKWMLIVYFDENVVNWYYIIDDKMLTVILDKQSEVKGI